MLSRISLSFLSFFLTSALLFAQTSTGPVSSPQRGTTYANEAVAWYNQPLVWMGLILIVLLVVLLLLRGKNRPTHNRLHKY